MERSKFTFFASFEEAFRLLDDSKRLSMYDSITAFALHGIEPHFSDPILQMGWTLIKPILSKGIVLSENGKKGGAPKGSRNNPNGRRGNVVDNQTSTNQELTKNLPLNNQEQTTPIIGIGKGKATEIGFKESTIVPKKSLSLTIEQRKENFKNELAEFRDKYSSDMLNEFFKFWVEPNKSNTKMRYELERTWKLSSRLSRWSRNNFGGRQWNR